MSGTNTEKSDTDSGSQGQATSQHGQSATAQEVPAAATTAQEEPVTTIAQEEQATTTEESSATYTQKSQTATTQEGQTTSTTQESQVSTTQGSQATTTTTTTEESQAATTQEGQSATTTTTMRLTRPWNLIYSEPFIFTDMIKSYGVQGLVVHDVLPLSQLPKLPLDTTYAIILAYKYKDSKLPENLEEDDEDAENIIFSNQAVVNSCATQSLVNTLTNLDIERGQLIQGFMDFTEDMSPVNRGIALGNTVQFKEIHNSYGEPVDVEEDVEEGKEYKTENTYHFVTYLPKNGFLWELDSLKLRPTKLMTINEGENWLNLLKPFLNNKIKSDELEANLLAVVKDPIVEKEEQLANLVARDGNLDRELHDEILNPLEARSSTAPIRGSNLTSQGRQLQNEQLKLKKQIKKLQDDIAFLKKVEADTSAKIEKYKKGNLSLIGRMARITVSSGTGLTAQEQPTETYTTEGRGKTRATHIGPKTKKAITKQGKQAVQRGRGRGRGGRGARGRGTRGRGQAKVSAKNTPKASTSSTRTKADTSSTSKKGENKKKRSFDDVEAEASRKKAVTKRFNLRRK